MNFIAFVAFWFLTILWGIPLAEKFIEAKIKNDTQIAADTKRIADALEAKNKNKETK